jgi:hypothetical protein
VSLAPGGFGLVPASIAVSIDSQPFSRFLRIQPN